MKEYFVFRIIDLGNDRIEVHGYTKAFYDSLIEANKTCSELEPEFQAAKANYEAVKFPVNNLTVESTPEEVNNYQEEYQKAVTEQQRLYKPFKELQDLLAPATSIILSKGSQELVAYGNLSAITNYHPPEHYITEPLKVTDENGQEHVIADASPQNPHLHPSAKPRNMIDLEQTAYFASLFEDAQPKAGNVLYSKEV